MNDKFREIGSSKFGISRKLLCVVLSVALLFQTGCYATRVTRFEGEGNPALHQAISELKKGQGIRVSYDNGERIKRIKGILEEAASDGIVVSTKIPGMYRREETKIAMDQILAIEVVDKHLDVVGSVMATTFFAGMVLVLVGGIYVLTGPSLIGD